jgi:hypothetical protein
LVLVLPLTAGPASADERLDHFENRIRPVLVKHCLACHGEDPADLSGGLSLLSGQATIAGGDAGPAITPGDAEASLLIKALRYDSEIEMPPEGRLPQAVIDDFVRWINDGAVDPRSHEPTATEKTAKAASTAERAKEHWAFQPLRARASTTTNVTGEDPIDSLIDQRLSAAGLKRSPPASPAALLRRLSFDLTGLPPTPAMTEAFVREPSEQAYQRMVDQLLASEEFGRHWGRHWLDVARYADSNGSDFNATFHQAWRYRDYVIDAFNQDKPFDRFVAEQIAGDLLPADNQDQRSAQLIATGFLMLGPKMLSERDKAKLQMDVVDDQIDTIGRAMMGLTLGCARCHDHKFDPIPTSDYYSLAGIFRSTDVLQGEIQKYVSNWIETPLPADQAHEQAIAEFASQEKTLVQRIRAAEAKLKAAQTSLKDDGTSIVIDDAGAVRKGHWVESVYSRPFIGAGYLHDDNRDKGSASLEFSAALKSGRYQVSLAYTAQANRSRRTPATIRWTDELGSAKTQDIEIDQTQAPEQSPWRKMADVTLPTDQNITVTFRNEGTDGYVIVDAVRFVPLDDAARRSLAKANDTDQKPNVAPESPNPSATKVADAERELKELREQVTKLRASKPEPLPMAMAVRDSKEIGDTFVCVRGEVSLRGETVARGFLSACQPSGSDATSAQGVKMPADQSGRVQLAQWICDPDHPLTARVIVNRVWMHLIGEGLVRSVDNFGVLGEAPSHPELLDELAIDFLRDGWSIKRLIRRIVNSQTYRQSTDFNEYAAQVDAENRLLWRMHRKRLPAESIRDSLLMVASELDLTSSIAPVARFGTLVSENVAAPKEIGPIESQRRSVFLPVIRGQVNDLLSVFDFADPDLLVGRRERTIVPSQALVMMNHPWILERSRKIATEILQGTSSESDAIRLAYLSLYSRYPTADENTLMSEFLKSMSDSGIDATSFAEMVGAMVGSSEFRLID